MTLDRLPSGMRRLTNRDEEALMEQLRQLAEPETQDSASEDEETSDSES